MGIFLLKFLVLLLLPGMAVEFAIFAPFTLDKWLKTGPVGHGML